MIESKMRRLMEKENVEKKPFLAIALYDNEMETMKSWQIAPVATPVLCHNLQTIAIER